MSKRMTDTDKWKKPFIRGLKAPYKLLWFYLLDECDHAGVWHVDLEVAEIRVGEKFEYDEILKVFGDKVYPFDAGTKFLIPDFIEFQYGTLKPENRVHQSVLEILERYNIKINKGLVSPLNGAKDKDKDKDKDKAKDKSEIENFYSECSNVKKLKDQPTPEQLQKLVSIYGIEAVKECLLSMENYKELPKKYVSVYLTANNWLSRDAKKPKAIGTKPIIPEPVTDKPIKF